MQDAMLNSATTDIHPHKA